MFHPFIDCSRLSDDELLKRIQRCQDIVLQSNMLGHNNMYHSALLQLETYRSEWEERMFKRRADEENEKHPPGVIEIGTIQEIPSKYKEE